MSNDESVSEVLAAEHERCRALCDQDWEPLEDLLADELTHTHANGMTEDKATYMQAIRGRPRKVKRGDIKVRVYGDVAVLTGPLFNEFGDRTIDMYALQVWRRTQGKWQQVAFQAAMGTG
jgi:hypothetical protein